MTEGCNKIYDFEQRTLEFSKSVIRLCKKLPVSTINIELTKQIMRSACSVGANYREANEALSKKDSLHRLRISRKEAKESSYWLDLILEANMGFRAEIDAISRESIELRNILSSMIVKIDDRS